MALAGFAQWTEHVLVKGMYLSYRTGPGRGGCRRQPVDVKINGKVSSGKDFKKVLNVTN